MKILLEVNLIHLITCLKLLDITFNRLKKNDCTTRPDCNCKRIHAKDNDNNQYESNANDEPCMGMRVVKCNCVLQEDDKPTDRQSDILNKFIYVFVVQKKSTTQGMVYLIFFLFFFKIFF